MTAHASLAPLLPVLRLRSRSPDAVAEVVTVGVNHNATPDEIAQAHAGNPDVDSHRAGSVRLDIAQVAGAELEGWR